MFQQTAVTYLATNRIIALYLSVCVFIFQKKVKAIFKVWQAGI